MPVSLVRPATSRNHPNWVETFIEATSGTASPLTLRRWSAIYTVAAALERCCWITTSRGALYPNLYVFLVAPPGIGKTLVLKQARNALESLGDDDQHIHTSPTNMSSAALADALNEAKRRINHFSNDPLKPFPTFNSLAVIVPELQTLFPTYDPGMMSTLTDLFDCDAYKEKKRGNSLNIDIPNSQVSILGACTPSTLHDVIPPQAWDQGFMSRVIMAYSGESISQPMFGQADRIDIPRSLQDDLDSIFNMYGAFSATPEYIDAYHKWESAGYEPAPIHPKLQHYNTRRKALLLKLSITASAAESSDLILDQPHFEQAYTWLTDAESFMPEVFKSSGLGGDAAIMHECFQFTWNLYMSDGQKPIAEQRILTFLRNRISAHLMFQLLDVMVRSGMFKKLPGQMPFYIPQSVDHHQA